MKTLIAILIAVPALAQAQDVNFARLDADTNIATLTTGAEHGLVLGGGYGRVVPFADRTFVLGGDLSLQWAEVDPSDFRLRLGVQAPIVEGGAWRVIGAVNAIALPST